MNTWISRAFPASSPPLNRFPDPPLRQFHASMSPFFPLALLRSVAPPLGFIRYFITDEPKSLCQSSPKESEAEMDISTATKAVVP
ncbi:hypothetical protein SAMN00790413_06344 [Deinococcus hopiensis KR-140]|uniref:Uncharacterized protein n=1 Tax=Deinococcus hopiensis KR-140 TaxID=695939 RepID=A0A1W1VUQ4_9DEIO|nr:hypothetical protein SAMN00790413_06344 [Deinococcus hopiensis KR-140]